MIAKKPEAQTVIVLLFISLIVCVAGFLLYKNISSISKDISSSYNYETAPSLIMRKVIAEIRDAENNVKSYNLTTDKDYLISFYTSVALVDEELTELKVAHRIDKESKVLIDSAVVLCERKFEILKKQLYLDDEKIITEELNAISVKIKQSYPLANDVSTVKISFSDNPEPDKEGFLKRLFGKKKKNNDSLTKTLEQLKQKEEQIKRITGEIKHTVQKVKISQIEKLQERQRYELQLANEGKQLIDNIRTLYLQMETHEKQVSILKIELANEKMNDIKTLSIALSIFISILLLIVGYFIVTFIQRKKQYELALVNSKEKAEDLAKTKELFLANMSHEIKTPLNAIYGFTEQVLHSDLNQKQKEQLNIVRKAADHLIKLITNILNYSKLQAGKIALENSDFYLKEELKEIETLFQQQTNPKDIHLTFSVDDNLPTVINCDVTKLKQVLFNLIGNAIKFTDKGFVKIEVSKNNKLINNQKSLHIKISDSGIGIAKNKLPLLFNEYEQVHSDISKKYGGTGLGLVITKKLLEQVGGSITLNSIAHKGTEVTVVFPYHLPDEEKLSNKKHHPITDLNVNTLQGKNILIVDDEEYNRMLLKTILLKYQINVAEATNGFEALELIKTSSYDLVLMDINMPLKNGTEACSEIRKLKNKGIDQLPILASTAVTLSEEKISNYKNSGFNGFINKPFTETNLLESLQRFLSFKYVEITQPIEYTEITSKLVAIPKKLNFNHITEVANGDENFKKEMIGIFYKSINNGAIEIEHLCKEKNWQKAADVAHKIMPPCKHFEAVDLYNTLKYFESLREQQSDLTNIDAKLKQLKANIETVNNELKLYL